LIVSQEQPSATSAGAACDYCGAPAIFKCRCGKLCCPAHHQQMWTAPLCSDCYQRSSTINVILTVAVVVLFGGIALAALLTQR
jgi:hypothetical protein